MRAWVALTALGVVGLVVSVAWLAAEVAHMLSEPPIPHDHFSTVMQGFLASVTLLALSIALLLEGHTARRRTSQRRAAHKRSF